VATGPVPLDGISVEAVRDRAFQIQQGNGLPLEITAKSTNPSRFPNQLSNALAAEENRSLVPSSALQRWLSRVRRIEWIG